jgi:cell division protein ZapE
MRDLLPTGEAAARGEGPLAAYRRRRAEGRLEPDPAQLLAAEKLQSLHNALERQAAAGRGGWLDRLGFGQRAEPVPHGIYIFGDVGRGKSMLMDLFFAGAPVAAKRRVHFHEFMLEVHDALHRWRKGASGDPIPPLAESIAAETRLLCFDEFQVTNIADAMLLGRLFTALFDAGITMVATSNWLPDDLYLGGLQRERFLPFIDLLKAKLDILELDGGTDFRRRRIRNLAVYHTPLGANAERKLAESFEQLTDNATPVATTLAVQGRQLPVPKTAKGVAWFRFDELCRKPLGSADYLAIATHFHTVILDGIPRMQAEERNEARRFTTLIDALYEHRTHLIAAAADVPDRLYPAGDNAFDFRRTASRLIEMQSGEYLVRPHLP